MKKIAILFTLFVLFQNLHSQALQKGNFDLYAGLGFGSYTFTNNDYEDNSTPAIPGLINVGVAYQITEGFALGIVYERNGFATDPDSNNRAISHNIGLSAGYNVINNEKNVLQPFLTVGTSYFRFDNFDDEDYITASGAHVQLGLTWKHYFGDVFGIYLNTSVPYYSYNEFKNSSGDTYEVSRLVFKNGVPTVESRVLQATMVGINFRFGINLKF